MAINWWKVAAEVLHYAGDKAKAIGEELTVEGDKLEPARIVNSKTPLVQTGFSVRTYNALNKLGIKYDEDLHEMAPTNLVQLGLGDTAISDIRDYFYRKGKDWYNETA
jgi:hypothetical protein